jgi:hypothetical protein
MGKVQEVEVRRVLEHSRGKGQFRFQTWTVFNYRPRNGRVLEFSLVCNVGTMAD